MLARFAWAALLTLSFACDPRTTELPLPPMPSADAGAKQCAISFRPQVLDFGVVAEARAHVRSASLANAGDADCELVELFLRDGAALFELNIPALPFTIPPDTRTDFLLAIRPTTNTSYDNVMVAVTADGERLELPIFGSFFGESHLLVTPSSVDFATPLDCPQTLEISVYNTGSAYGTFTPVLEDSVVFALADPREYTLAPGQSATLEVTFTPTSEGRFTSSLLADTTTVTLAGETHSRRVTDVFDLGDRPLQDILFVIDDNTAIAEERALIESNLQAFSIFAAQYDAQFAITTTNMDNTGAQGRLLPLEGARILTATSSWNDWLAILPGANSSARSRGLQAVEAALNEPLRSTHNAGFPREGARLHAIIISVEDDASAGDLNRYIPLFRRTNNDLTVVAGDNEGCSAPFGEADPSPRYATATFTTNGTSLSICDEFWSTGLESVLLASVAPRRYFRLSERPRASTFEVVVDGKVLARARPDGTANWTWDGNTFTFDAAAAPAWGSHLQINYELGCD